MSNPYGTITVISGTSSVDVSYPTASGYDYSVVVQLENTIDPIPSLYTYSVSAKDADGFTVSFSSEMDTGNYVLNYVIGTTSSGSGVSDHGALTGLTDDDHPQYLTRTDFATYSGSVNGSVLTATPSDLSASGDITTMTVDANSVGFGAGLYIASDGNLELAGADNYNTMPCVAVALASGIGEKQVLTKGFIRNDNWSWASVGRPVYMSTTNGVFTQDVVGSGEFLQVIGVARATTVIYFDPDFTIIEVA